VLIGGFFLMGLSKILWIEAIHRLPITQTISVASIQPLFTMFFAYILLHQAPEWVQLLSLPPIAGGMYLLTKKPVLQQVVSDM
jgi:drug/metabolite transporter (DMT)-like permease